MKKILVIETSATLRHGLIKSLSDIPNEFLTMKSYELGLEALERYLDGNPDDLAAVIVGWPGQTSAAADEVITLLGEDESLRKLATLVMAVEVDRVKLDWVVQRHNSALLLWEDYTDVSVSLSKLLESTEQPKEKIKPPSRPEQVNNAEDKIRVLLVDDSPTVRVFYKRLFIDNGYATEAASCYDEAIEMACNNYYDIAVIDYFMPDVNGDQLVKKLKDDEATQHIWPVIFTGTYLDQVIKDSLDAGAIECMFKNEADELVIARLDAVSRTIRANRAVETERRRLEGILSSVGDGVYGVDIDGLITFINPAACRILGRHECTSELVGKTPHSLFHYALSDGTPSDPHNCFLQQAYGSGDLLHAWETIFWSEDSKPIPVECTVYPLQIDNQLQGSVVAFRDISERKILEEELKWQVNHDHLTKLLNRHYFDEELRKEVKRLKRSDESSALLYIDLDRFKYLNDTAGHTAGDQLLVEVGQQLSARLRASDMLARLGGDEFAVILRNINIDMISTLADQYREVLHNCTFYYQGQQYKIDGSVGVAVISQRSKSPDEVLAHADIACHMAKQQGRNQTHVYKAEDEKMSMDLDLGWSARLREALLNNLFELHYQPISNLGNLNLGGLPSQGPILTPEESIVDIVPSHYEVLIRLRPDDSDSLIFPNAFIPTAERFNLMQEIDRWVIENAIRQLALSNSTGQKVNFAINLSGHSLGDDSVLPFVIELLHEYNADPNDIIFEITETTAISNMEAAQKLINELSALGIRFSLDDFGCGFSSFAHLKQLQADYIKIDGMFVQGMLSDPIDQAMVRSMNDIAHSLGKKTIAEFVENLDILKKLDELGIDYVQGYYIGKPTTHVY